MTMRIAQHPVVSSVATQIYNSLTSGSFLNIQNLGPTYKIYLLSASNQNISDGYPLCAGKALTLQVATNSELWARLPAQVGALASTVFSEVAVFQTP